MVYRVARRRIKARQTAYAEPVWQSPAAGHAAAGSSPMQSCAVRRPKHERSRQPRRRRMHGCRRRRARSRRCDGLLPSTGCTSAGLPRARGWSTPEPVAPWSWPLRMEKGRQTAAADDPSSRKALATALHHAIPRVTSFRSRRRYASGRLAASSVAAFNFYLDAKCLEGETTQRRRRQCDQHETENEHDDADHI